MLSLINKGKTCVALSAAANNPIPISSSTRNFWRFTYKQINFLYQLHILMNFLQWIKALSSIKTVYGNITSAKKNPWYGLSYLS